MRPDVGWSDWLCPTTFESRSEPAERKNNVTNNTWGEGQHY